MRRRCWHRPRVAVRRAAATRADGIGLARRRRHGRWLARWSRHVALPEKGMPAGRRAFPHAQDQALFVHLLWVRVSGPAAGWAVGSAVADSRRCCCWRCWRSRCCWSRSCWDCCGLRSLGSFIASSPWRCDNARDWAPSPPGTHPRRNGLPAVSFILGQPDPQDMETCDEQKICTCRARGLLRRAAGNRLGSIGGRLRGAVEERRRQQRWCVGRAPRPIATSPIIACALR